MSAPDDVSEARNEIRDNLPDDKHPSHAPRGMSTVTDVSRTAGGTTEKLVDTSGSRIQVEEVDTSDKSGDSADLTVGNYAADAPSPTTGGVALGTQSLETALAGALSGAPATR